MFNNISIKYSFINANVNDTLAFYFLYNNLYKKLRTLETDGILQSVKEPSAQGANRKYYSLTPFGKSFLKEISTLIVPVIDSFYENIESLK